MLVCGHTVCLACLVRLISENKDQKSIKCPFDITAHKATDIPVDVDPEKVSTIISAFPQNAAIAHSLQSADGLKPKCSRKECSGAPAASFCVRCRKNLCAACSEYHVIFCPTHSAVPVARYLPAQKDLDERASKDAQRKAAYEKAIKDAEDAKKKAEEEDAKKEAAEIAAINSKSTPTGPSKIGSRIAALKSVNNNNNNDNTNVNNNSNSPVDADVTSPKVISPKNVGMTAPESSGSSSGSVVRKQVAATVRTAAAAKGAAGVPKTAATVRTPSPHRSGTESPLPEGWTEVIDKKSGKKYYYNKTTKKTSWHRPAEETPSPAPEEAPPEDHRALPEGWTEVIDKKSGKKYYYNKTTKKTSWHLPEN